MMSEYSQTRNDLIFYVLYSMMHVGNMFPICSLLGRRALVPAALGEMERQKGFGRLWGPSGATRLGSARLGGRSFEDWRS